MCLEKLCRRGKKKHNTNYPNKTALMQDILPCCHWYISHMPLQGKTIFSITYLAAVLLKYHHTPKSLIDIAFINKILIYFI